MHWRLSMQSDQASIVLMLHFLTEDAAIDRPFCTGLFCGSVVSQNAKRRIEEAVVEVIFLHSS
jgi:hypothetical protein